MSHESNGTASWVKWVLGIVIGGLVGVASTLYAHAVSAQDVMVQKAEAVRAEVKSDLQRHEDKATAEIKELREQLRSTHSVLLEMRGDLKALRKEGE